MALSAATSWPGTRGAARRAGPGPRAALGWRGGLWSPRPPHPGDGLNEGWRAASPCTEPGAGSQGRGGPRATAVASPGLPLAAPPRCPLRAGRPGPGSAGRLEPSGRAQPAAPRPGPAPAPAPAARPGTPPRASGRGRGRGGEEPPGALGRSRASPRAGARGRGPRGDARGGVGAVSATQRGASRARARRRSWPWESGEHYPLLPFPLHRPSGGQAAPGVSPKGPSLGPVPKDPGGAPSLSGRSFQPDQGGNPKGRQGWCSVSWLLNSAWAAGCGNLAEGRKGCPPASPAISGESGVRRGDGGREDNKRKRRLDSDPALPSLHRPEAVGPLWAPALCPPSELPLLRRRTRKDGPNPCASRKYFIYKWQIGSGLRVFQNRCISV